MTSGVKVGIGVSLLVVLAVGGELAVLAPRAK